MRLLALATFILLASFGMPSSVSADVQSCIADGGSPAVCQCEANGGAWNLSDGTCSTGTTVQTGPGGSSPVQTGPGGGGSNVTLINPLGPGTTLSSFLLSILSIITDTIGPIIVILMLVYVGFKFVAAQGVPGKLEEARGMLLWTVVGALILLGAKVIAMGILATVQALSTVPTGG